LPRIFIIRYDEVIVIQMVGAVILAHRILIKVAVTSIFT
jgi:hypothetical protein